MVATSKGKWVDGPYKLLESPASTRDINRHYAIAMSNEMSCVHNCFIRAFNSILLQGPNVPSHGQPLYEAKDVKDLCTFMDCTIMSLNHHHDSEEKVLFPALEREIGMMGYLDVASEQHKEFHDGLFALWNYVKAGMLKPEDWRWDEMQKLFEVFMPALLVHLAEEVDLLLTLERFEEAGLRKAWDESIDEAKKVGLAGMYTIFPVMFGCHDRTLGTGPPFPPVPNAFRYVVHYGTSWKHNGAWRFCPSDFWSNPRPLTFSKS